MTLTTLAERVEGASEIVTLRAMIADRDKEIAMLRRRFNEALADVASRDTFVRWFATEYGLATFGRKPVEMMPGKVGVARWVGWFSKALGRKPTAAALRAIASEGTKQ